ncbi:MAG: aldo/keto reductase [Acidimicrobiales bacterium]|nr:aldo/keto reductase [Acidimicrobiales bacterium]
MEYPCLGRTGFRISEVVLGGATFGELNDEADVARLVHAALDRGVTTIDTADFYAQGRSEELIGKAIAGRRDRLVIMSKFGNRVGDTVLEHAALIGRPINHADRWAQGISPNDQGLSRGHILTAVEASLRRLGTDYIDVYQMHGWDEFVAPEETLNALDDLVRAGKVRYVGCSNLTPERLDAYLQASTSAVRAVPRSMQLGYNLVTRDAEREIIPFCEASGVSVLAIMPLAGGLLAGRYRQDEEPETGSRIAARPMYRDRFWNDRTFNLVAGLDQLAQGSGRTVGQLAVGWVLANPSVTAAVLGAEHAHEFEEIVMVADKPLEPAELKTIAALLDAG